MTWWLVCPFHSAAARDRFQAGEVTNLLFNYFKGFNEEVIGSDAEIRGSIVKCGERQFKGRGGVFEISVWLPINNGTMEVMEYICVDMWCMLDWVIGLHLFLYKQFTFDTRPKNCLSFSKKLPQKIVYQLFSRWSINFYCLNIQTF